MVTIYYDDDASLEVLAGKTIAVIGYGNQGRSQALNLRDSGFRVVVGNVRDGSFEQAQADGFETTSIGAASDAADVVLLLTPDEVMPQVYTEHVARHMRAGDVLCFAHGYNIAFGLIEPAEKIDVVMIAPRMIGPGVRDLYLAGVGFPSFVGVHQDGTGEAGNRMLSIAKGIGSTRAGCLEMSMLDEATLDLFTEQAFGPAFGRVMMTAIDVLVEAGYPPEAILLELYLSGELAYTFQKMRDVGFLKQMDFHSHTSQYGSVTRSGKFGDLEATLKAKMQDVLAEIRSGAFAAEWTREQASGTKILEQIRAIREQLPLNQWEQRARAAFRIGDAVQAGTAPPGGEEPEESA